MYRVFGYNAMCEEFEFHTDSFTEAVRYFKDRDRNLCVCFIRGVSPKVANKLFHIT